jgi:hypothetical protein
VLTCTRVPRTSGFRPSFAGFHFLSPRAQPYQSDFGSSFAAAGAMKKRKETDSHKILSEPLAQHNTTSTVTPPDLRVLLGRPIITPVASREHTPSHTLYMRSAPQSYASS